jgi:biopolymer transport protein ExbD
MNRDERSSGPLMVAVLALVASLLVTGGSWTAFTQYQQAREDEALRATAARVMAKRKPASDPSAHPISTELLDEVHSAFTMEIDASGAVILDGCVLEDDEWESALAAKVVGSKNVNVYVRVAATAPAARLAKLTQTCHRVGIGGVSLSRAEVEGAMP